MMQNWMTSFQMTGVDAAEHRVQRDDDAERRKSSAADRSARRWPRRSPDTARTSAVAIQPTRQSNEDRGREHSDAGVEARLEEFVGGVRVQRR
jgi:hypothetical protein